jgi:hypothetical protein
MEGNLAKPRTDCGELLLTSYTAPAALLTTTPPRLHPQVRAVDPAQLRKPLRKPGVGRFPRDPLRPTLISMPMRRSACCACAPTFWARNQYGTI